MKFFVSKESIEVMRQVIDVAELKDCTVDEALTQVMDCYRRLDKAVALKPSERNER